MGNNSSTTNKHQSYMNPIQQEENLIQVMNDTLGKVQELRMTDHKMDSSTGSSDADKISSILTCSICIDQFEGDPRMMPCGHTNCTRCLEELRRIGNHTIKFPQCQKPYTLPIIQLPVNFVAKQLVEELRNRQSANNDGTSDNKSNQQATTTLKDGSGDVWTFEEGLLYRWKEWSLIRNGKNALFIWCNASILKLNNRSSILLCFFINDRLGFLPATDVPTEFYEDDADNRAYFFSRLQNAKAAIPSGVQTQSILSVVPRETQKIHFGNWDLSSVEDGTMLVTNREHPKQKLTIKDEFVYLGSRLLGWKN